MADDSQNIEDPEFFVDVLVDVHHQLIHVLRNHLGQILINTPTHAPLAQTPVAERVYPMNFDHAARILTCAVCWCRDLSRLAVTPVPKWIKQAGPDPRVRQREFAAPILFLDQFWWQLRTPMQQLQLLQRWPTFLNRELFQLYPREPSNCCFFELGIQTVDAARRVLFNLYDDPNHAPLLCPLSMIPDAIVTDYINQWLGGALNRFQDLEQISEESYTLWRNGLIAERDEVERLLRAEPQARKGAHQQAARIGKGTLKGRILIAAYSLQASSEDTLYSASEIADEMKRHQPQHIEPTHLKDPLRYLTEQGYMESKTGRGGGYYLLDKGRQKAEELKNGNGK